MPPLKLAAIAALLFALGGCQTLPSLPLSAQRIVTEHTPNGCQGEQCPLVNIDTLDFAATRRTSRSHPHCRLTS
jgi:hypothetical protein